MRGGKFSLLSSAPQPLIWESGSLASHRRHQRRPGGLHERAPTRQCQPIFLPWLQPGGLKPGSRTSARERRVVRGWTIAILDARALKLDPTPIPAPIPIIGRASVGPATASGKPTAAIKRSRYLRMISLLYWLTFLRTPQERLNGLAGLAGALSALPRSRAPIEFVFCRLLHWRSHVFNKKHAHCVPQS